MMSWFKLIRSIFRSSNTLILIFIIIILTFTSFHFYRKDKHQQRSEPNSRLATKLESSSFVSSISTIERVAPEVTKQVLIEKSTSQDVFAKYASDEHLLSLLRTQSNSRRQVLVTITGGDSYSLFAWDWHKRMLEISNDTNNCHCFVVAMDEIAVILSIQQGVPVYYSTFTFEQQMQWINVIEARQHSLYRVGHAKFFTTAKIAQMGYSVMLSEMDVFWKENPFNHLKEPSDVYDFQISHHFGAHPRVNIGVFYVRSSNASIAFISHVAEFWLRYGKGGYLSDQRALDALLNNYDRLDKTYLKAIKSYSPSALNWTTHDFGIRFSHLMTDGSAFILFNQAAKFGIRSKQFYGDPDGKFFTVTVNNTNMTINQRNLLIRALLILQHSQYQNRTLILPAFSSNLTTMPITFQLDIKKFFLYWTEERIRLPEFLSLTRMNSVPVTKFPYSSDKTYLDVNGILELTLDSIPLNLPPPSPQFEVHIRDSLLWCSPPTVGGVWCTHHPRDFAVTMEILFACRGDPYPPCANKTTKNEQFLERPYEHE